MWGRMWGRMWDAHCKYSSAIKRQRSSSHAIGMNKTNRHWRLANVTLSVNAVSQTLSSCNPSIITPSMAGLRNKIMRRRTAWLVSIKCAFSRIQKEDDPLFLQEIHTPLFQKVPRLQSSQIKRQHHYQYHE